MDNSRSGYDPYEPQLRTAVSAWNSSTLDGPVYAEPLLDNGVVFVATENDSIYALNATTGTTIWRTNLGIPIPGSSLPCGDIDPSGITGTPVIDAAAGRIYAVAYIGPGKHMLVSLNLNDGSVNFMRDVDPSGADVSVLQQRAALTLSGGMIYVAYGGLDGDCGDYHGWVIAAPTNNSAPLLSYEVPTQGMGGIWSVAGPPVDSSGNILVAVGNSAATSTTSVFDYGDSVVRLSPTLQVKDYWAPSDWQALNAGDTDVGSISPSILGENIIFQSGKDGNGYLLNQTNLGGIGGELYSSSICDSAFGGTAYAAPNLYVPCTSGLFALNVKTGSNPSFSGVWNVTGFWAGPPIVAGGAVWTVDIDNSTLFAFSATNGNTLFKYPLGSVVHFESPTSGGGRLFVAAGNSICAFSI
jgi:outer membrane protein assembly factor BamB